MKILPSFKKFKKKRKQQLQEKEKEARDITEHSSQESLQCSDENEDVKNTTDDFHQNFKELIEGYENDEDEFIDMSQPRDASYISKTKYNYNTYEYEIDKTKRLGKDIDLTSAATSYRSMDTQFRGITLRQLRAILPLIKRRCNEEKWTRKVYKDGKETDEVENVTLETATLYDINKYIIKPFTKSSQKSFVETLPSTKGTQPPRWFVSHYWGETFVHTMACLEQMVEDFEYNNEKEDDRRGGGMTEDTPIWICAFANNQHNLDSEITSNPADSAFAKAMKIANFRVISILDVNNQVYNRLWCMYELYLTLILSKEQENEGVLAIYTYHEHEFEYNKKTIQKSAIGIVEGGPTNHQSKRCYRDSQEQFPKDRFFKSLSISIQDAKASAADDRKHILNALVESGDLKLEPPKVHEMYEKLNNAVRGVFASTTAFIPFAYNNEYWEKTLYAMKHSETKIRVFDKFHLDKFKAENIAEQFRHLPIELKSFSTAFCPYGRVEMDALFYWLENTSTNLKILRISNTFIGGEVDGKEFGERLARFLTRDKCKIEKLVLSMTDLVGSRNVDTWIECLQKNTSLTDVEFRGLEFLVQYANNFVDTLYWDGKTFPDGMLSKQQEEIFKKKFEQHAILKKFNEFVLEESTANTQQKEAETSDNKANVVEEIVLKESTAVGEKPTSNWLCGVVSCF